MKKLKGEAVITLKNAKTGKIEYQKKQNIVTKIPGIATKTIPYGFGEYAPSLIDVMGGMLLFQDTNTVDENNYKLSQLPVGWSGIEITSISDCGKGYLVPSQCSYDGNKVVITHEWGTSQANGTISSISLTNPVGCMKKAYLLDNCFWTYGNTKHLTAGNWKNQLGIEANKLGHILHVDVENNLFYEMTNDADYQTLHFRKIKRSVDKLLLNEATHAEYLNIKGSSTNYFSTNLSTLIEEKNLRLTNALNWNDNTQLTNSFHYDPENDILYIFSLYQAQAIQITKISNVINGTPSETTSTLDLSNIFSANSNLGSSIFWKCRHLGTTISQNKILIKDALGFRNGYLYVQTDGIKMLKLNINDLSDYRILDLSALFYNGGDGAFINDGNLFYGKTSKYTTGYSAQSVTVVIDMINDVIQIEDNSTVNFNYDSSGNTSSSSLYANNTYSNNEFCAINEAWYLEYNPYFEAGSSYDSANVSVVLNPAYMATINNITPILKTSAQTLTVQYTLQEIEETEENNTEGDE